MEEDASSDGTQRQSEALGSNHIAITQQSHSNHLIVMKLDEQRPGEQIAQAAAEEGGRVLASPDGLGRVRRGGRAVAEAAEAQLGAWRGPVRETASAALGGRPWKVGGRS